MAIKFDKVQAGDVLYDCHKYRMGNTLVTTMGTWKVKILEKSEHGCRVSWNGNTPRFWSIGMVEKLRRAPVKARPTIFDLARKQAQP